MENKYYKQTGKFNPWGVLLMTLSVFAVGTLLFAAYLFLVNKCPVVWLNVILAIIVGFIMGWVSGKFIYAFKIRNTFVAVLCCLVGFFGATYIKWTMYDYREIYVDLNNAINVTVEDMRGRTAFEYYNLQEKLEGYNGKNFYEVFSEMNKDKNDKNNAWHINKLDKILGNNYAESMKNLSKAKKTEAYEYSKNNKELLPDKVSFVTLLKSPRQLWTDIKQINSEGRWTIGRRLSSSGTNVNGVALWVVWAAEFAVLSFFMLIQVVEKSSSPFIESENEWAAFADMERTYRFHNLPGKADKIKANVERNPAWLFDYAAKPGEFLNDYVAVKMWHNSSRTENYMTLTHYCIDNEGKIKSSQILVKYLKVDKAFVQALQERFEPLRFSAESFMKRKV